MAKIVMTDDGISFDGLSLERGPLGGAETAFLSLAQALAQRGHSVSVHNMCDRAMEHAGVAWRPLSEGTPDRADLYIANRSDRLIRLVPNARSCVFWIHNPARYLLKHRYLWKLWLRRPAIVFSGDYHAATYPDWAPAGERRIIPYGISETFRTSTRAEGLPKAAIFTSNPLRGLGWLLDLWVEHIYPACPKAELHVYSGMATYGSFGAARADAMQPILKKAQALSGKGVVLKEPVAKEKLAAALGGARALLYRGDPGETFCLAVGESQAMGVPAVVCDIGCVAERIENGETGFVAHNNDAFVDYAIRLLNEDALWRSQSEAAIARQRSWGWDEAAAEFEKLIPAAGTAP
jgi:hypothetical protein